MQKLPTPARFDPTRLDRLLTIIGPAQSGVFLGQLAADLADCETALLSDGRHDWTRLRATSHVLISLAGSAGAMALHDAAQALNAAAHAADGAAAAGLRPALLSDLATLIALVRGMQATTGAAR
jgi:hypothetical protein